MLTLCLSLLLMITNSQITDKKEEVMKFELIQLPYANDGLEPVISKQTIDFHYGKHLLNYVNTLNKLIEGTKFENAPLEQIVRESDGAIFNNAGQVLNHSRGYQVYVGIVRELPERVRGRRYRLVRLRMGMVG